MARAIAAIIAFVVVVLVLARLEPTIAADTPISVIAATDVVLTLPVAPSIDRITSDLRQQLEVMASMQTDPRLRTALERFARDPELLVQVATTPVEMFDNGEAAATATAVYDVHLDPAGVTVVVATVELVPGYGATAVSRDHEDGHALINRRVAARCARPALESAVGASHRGETLINSIISQLSASSYPVHAAYHRLATGATVGQHLRLAELALQEVTDCSG